jgi:hypothetical protein
MIGAGDVAMPTRNGTSERRGPELPFFPPAARGLGGKLREQRSSQWFDQLAALDGIGRHGDDGQLVARDHPIAKANLIAPVTGLRRRLWRLALTAFKRRALCRR